MQPPEVVTSLPKYQALWAGCKGYWVKLRLSCSSKRQLWLSRPLAINLRRLSSTVLPMADTGGRCIISPSQLPIGLTSSAAVNPQLQSGTISQNVIGGDPDMWHLQNLSSDGQNHAVIPGRGLWVSQLAIAALSANTRHDSPPGCTVVHWLVKGTELRLAMQNIEEMRSFHIGALQPAP